jgi:hypothetical protein
MEKKSELVRGCEKVNIGHLNFYHMKLSGKKVRVLIDDLRTGACEADFVCLESEVDEKELEAIDRIMGVSR